MGVPADSVPSWVVPLVTFSAAVIASYANYRTQRWRARIDRLGTAIDNLCLEINAAADIATKYWLLDCQVPDNASQAYTTEFELLGRQARIQQLLITLRKQDSKLSLDSIDENIADFFDAVTGGNFQVSSRLPDVIRASSVQNVAAGLNGTLRQSLNQRTRRRF